MKRLLPILSILLYTIGLGGYTVHAEEINVTKVHIETIEMFNNDHNYKEREHYTYQYDGDNAVSIRYTTDPKTIFLSNINIQYNIFNSSETPTKETIQKEYDRMMDDFKYRKLSNDSNGSILKKEEVTLLLVFITLLALMLLLHLTS